MRKIVDNEWVSVRLGAMQELQKAAADAEARADRAEKSRTNDIRIMGEIRATLDRLGREHGQMTDELAAARKALRRAFIMGGVALFEVVKADVAAGRHLADAPSSETVRAMDVKFAQFLDGERQHPPTPPPGYVSRKGGGQ